MSLSGVPGPLRIGLAMFLCFPLGFRLLGKHPTLRHDKTWHRIGVAWAILGGWIVAFYSGVLILCLLPVVRFLKKKYPDLDLDRWVPADINNTIKWVGRELVGPDGTIKPKWIGLAIFLCFPIGLYLLWQHPTLGRDRRWWWVGGVWSLVILLAMANGDHGKRKTGGSHSVTVNSRTGPAVTVPTVGAGRNVQTNPGSALSTVEPPATLKTLLEDENFINAPPSAVELPDEVLTRDYYPFLEGKVKVVMYSDDVPWDATITLRRVYNIVPSSGVLKRSTRSIDRIVDGKIEGSLPESELKETDPPQRYRLRGGYVEIGMPSGSEISWTPILKLGAKLGDTWEQNTPIRHSKFRVKSVFMMGDRPCAIIVGRTHIKLDELESNTETTTWYVKGKGEYRSETKNIGPSGEAKVQRRGELVYFPD
jgi:hypothetical protein